MSQLKSFWESLQPENKRRAVISFVMGVVILFGVVAYSLRNEPINPKQATREKALSDLPPFSRTLF